MKGARRVTRGAPSAGASGDPPLKAVSSAKRAGGAAGDSMRLARVISLLAILLILWAGVAGARPATQGAPKSWGRSWITLTYSREEARPTFAPQKTSRGVIDGRVSYELPAGAGVWARARGSGPWSDDGASWVLTDLEAGPSIARHGLLGRFDVDGWLTLAASAGKEPEVAPWYMGLRDWSYGLGARISATVMGVGEQGHIRLGFDLRYRSQARPGWIYLAHHSVAIADSAEVADGAVLAWQARIETRSERVCLATVFLREELLDVGAILSGMEKPMYLIQSAAVRVWGPAGIIASGELLLSGDDGSTEYRASSVLPAWSVSLGLNWEYDF